MSASVDFQSQIASIMEVLANAAVAEICKVVDDGYAVVHLEMSQSHKDNEFLRRKIKLMELQIARFRAERMKFSEGSGSNRFGVRLLNRHGRETQTSGPTFPSRARLVNRNSVNKAVQDRSPNHDHSDASNHDVVTAKNESAEEEDLDLLIVKVEGAVGLDDTATSRDPGRPLEGDRELTQPAAATAKEEDIPKPAQPAVNAAGRKVTEVSGSRTAAVANNQSVDLNEGNCLLQSPLAQEWTDITANFAISASYGDVMDVESAPVRSEPRAASAVEQGVGRDPARAQREVIVIDAVSGGQAADRMYEGSDGRGVAEQIDIFRAGARELDAVARKPRPVHFDPARTNSLSGGGQVTAAFQASERSPSSASCAAPPPYVGNRHAYKPSYHNAAAHQRHFERPERAFPVGHFSSSSSQTAATAPHSGHLPVHLRAAAAAAAAVAAVERPFACALCRKRFVLESDLRKHCLNHNRLKQFACPVCHKGFISASQLNVHQNVHTGERPFGCRECGRNFSHPSNLRRHQKLQHNWREREGERERRDDSSH